MEVCSGPAVPAVDAGCVVHHAAGNPVVGTNFSTGVCTTTACDNWCIRGRSFLQIFGAMRLALGALADSRGEFLDVIEHLATLSHLAADLLFRVHHGGVVSPESLADLGQRQVGELAAEVHRDLP